MAQSSTRAAVSPENLRTILSQPAPDGAQLSPVTAAKYAQRLQVLYRLKIEDPGAAEVALDDFLDVGGTVAALCSGHTKATGEGWSLATKIGYLSALVKLTGLCPRLAEVNDAYSALLTELISEQRTRRDTNAFTPKERERHIDRSRVEKAARREALEPSVLNAQDAAIASLYALLPPRRVLDYAELRLAVDSRPRGDDASETNWLVVDGKTGLPKELYISVFKVARRMGPYSRTKFPKAVATALRRTIQENEVEPGFPVFPTHRGGTYAPSSFSGLVTDIFRRLTGVPGHGVNALRHAAVTALHDSRPTLAAKKRYAYDMGHHIATQAEYDRVNGGGAFDLSGSD